MVPIIGAMQCRNAPPRPSLAELRRGTPWFWLVCDRCLHRAPTLSPRGSSDGTECLERSTAPHGALQQLRH
jgi:hypothetical protein